ncbi:Nicotinamidase-related amidase [Blastococcus aggregatus]|uniref:Nicotinamidase-related amidase n=1 Tax=Blastococcus aggregatus TaxID=38502 RepID=A0A285V7E1_9ACTN|nr:isochorismatase family protein [Blastococcus aggregatus]SOC49508.1 Nicotinamidase-related amidase [Blastococcus aggregatus]
MSSNVSALDPFEDHCWRDVIPAETLEVYRSYQRETGIVGLPAVLAVDLFSGVFPEGPMTLADAVARNPRSCGPYAWAARTPIATLLNSARGRGLPVLFSSQNPETSRATNRPPSQRDAADLSLDPFFGPRAGELVVPKRRASVFFETDLADHLERLGVDTLILCGETTSGCVRATAVDAYSHGFHAVVVEEAVFDRSPLSHKVSLFDLHHKYADVMSLAQVEQALAACPASPSTAIRPRTP